MELAERSLERYNQAAKEADDAWNALQILFKRGRDLNIEAALHSIAAELRADRARRLFEYDVRRK